MATENEIDYAKITAIMHKMADWLQDLGFNTPRSDIAAAGRLNKAVESPRTDQDLAVIQEYMKSLAEDIHYEAQTHPADANVKKAQLIVSRAGQALAQCVIIH